MPEIALLTSNISSVAPEGVGDAFGQLLGTGLVGALLVIALYAYYLKDKQLSEEMSNRIKDAQEYQKLLMTVQQSVINAVHKLGEIVEWVEKRDEAANKEKRRP